MPVHLLTLQLFGGRNRSTVRAIHLKSIALCSGAIWRGWDTDRLGSTPLQGVSFSWPGNIPFANHHLTVKTAPVEHARLFVVFSFIHILKLRIWAQVCSQDVWWQRSTLWLALSRHFACAVMLSTTMELSWFPTQGNLSCNTRQKTTLCFSNAEALNPCHHVTSSAWCELNGLRLLLSYRGAADSKTS